MTWLAATILSIGPIVAAAILAFEGSLGGERIVAIQTKEGQGFLHASGGQMRFCGHFGGGLVCDPWRQRRKWLHQIGTYEMSCTGLLKNASAALIAFPAMAVSQPVALECQFGDAVFANVSEDLGVQIEVDGTAEMELIFVLQDDGSATLIGNNGASDVVTVWGDNKISFLEHTPDGTVQVTAIFGVGPGRKAAVHSRSSGGEGFEMPSQFYGFCEAK